MRQQVISEPSEGVGEKRGPPGHSEHPWSLVSCPFSTWGQNHSGTSLLIHISSSGWTVVPMNPTDAKLHLPGSCTDSPSLQGCTWKATVP